MQRVRALFGILCGVALLLSATAAHSAGDEPDKFNGGYAGLVGGYGFGDGNWLNGGFVPFNQNVDLDGGLAGITAGYNWRHDDFLYGVEADIQTLGLNDRVVCGFGGICTVDLDAMATVRARLGWVFGMQGQFAFFATGGLANVWHDATQSGAGGFRDNGASIGYAVGGGFEAYVMDTNWVSTKIDFLYVGGLDIKGGEPIFGTQTPVGPDSFAIDDLFFVRWGFNVHF